MTQLQLEMSRGAYKVAFIFERIFSFFGKVGSALIKARQDKANRMIADMMKHEYPHESYGYILRLVEERRANELHK
jgi:mannitol-1-phosphate/altronate dehydrogenase